MFIFILMYIFPLVYLFIGFILKNHHLKFPDFFSGYHVGHLAMKNEKTWEYANHYAGNFLIMIGSIIFGINVIAIVSYIIYVTEWNWNVIFPVYLLCIAFLPILFSIVFTQMHLTEKFDKNGNRKEFKYKGAGS